MKSHPVTTGYYWARLRGEAEFQPVHLIVTPHDDSPLGAWTRVEILEFGSDCSLGPDDVSEWGIELKWTDKRASMGGYHDERT